MPKADYDDLIAIKTAYFNQELVLLESEYYLGCYRINKFHAVKGSEVGAILGADAENIRKHKEWVNAQQEFHKSFSHENRKRPWWVFW